MSVPNQIPYIVYNANGMTTVFPFEFYIIAAGDIQVSINGTTVTSGFSVSGTGNVSGGDVVFMTPPANGSVVMLERVVPTYRLTDYQDNGDLLADTINKDFDRLWMAIQHPSIYLGLALKRPLLGGPFDAEDYRIEKLADPVNPQDAATKKYVESVSLARVLRVPESSVGLVPPVASRANQLLAFNASGDPITVLPPSGSASEVLMELAKPTGAKRIGYGDVTVDDALNKLEKTQGKDGFNAVGRFLNLAELRAFPPAAVGDVVYVVSAASTSIEDIHYGGGYFQAVRKASLVDDGGMTIVPSSGSFAWRRIQYDNVYIEYFGAKGDGVSDSTSAILAAMNYGKNKKVSIHAGAGIFETSSTIPVWGRSGLLGEGRDVTIFEKTTNNPYTISTGVTADAFICILPDVYSPDGTDVSNYAILTTLDGFTLRRKGITGRENAVAYGIWAGKLAASQLKNIRVECGNFGFLGEDVFSNTFESLQFLGLGVGQYCGFQISRYRSGVYALSGTSNVLNLVGVAGYQLGFMMDSMQYSTMNSCTADGIRPMSGTTETFSSAYRFTNPHGITMNGCGSEGVSGERLTLIMDNFAVYDGAITINSYQGQIVQENPKVASTPIFRIQSTSAKFLSVSIINCNLKKDPSLSNQDVGFINGANTQVFNIGSIVDVPTLSGGAIFKSL